MSLSYRESEDCVVKHNSDRKWCRFCRLKKCCEVGMRMDTDDEDSTKKNSDEEWPGMTSETKELVNVFVSTMPTSMSFTSPSHAFGALKMLIQNVPQLASVFPKEEKEMNFLIKEIMSGFLAIRAAFTFDEICFIENEQMEQRISFLRMGIRNTVFNDGEVALLSGIYILQKVTGASSNNDKNDLG